MRVECASRKHKENQINRLPFFAALAETQCVVRRGYAIRFFLFGFKHSLLGIALRGLCAGSALLSPLSLFAFFSKEGESQAEGVASCG